MNHFLLRVLVNRRLRAAIAACHGDNGCDARTAHPAADVCWIRELGDPARPTRRSRALA